MASIMLGIIGLGNPLRDQDGLGLIYYNKGAPGYEYRNLNNQMVSNFLIIYRYSIGEFGELLTVDYLDDFNIWVFWLLWILICYISCVIILNFIIAEVSASYLKTIEVV